MFLKIKYNAQNTHFCRFVEIYTLFGGDQVDLKTAGGGSKPILRTGKVCFTRKIRKIILLFHGSLVFRSSWFDLHTSTMLRIYKFSSMLKSIIPARFGSVRPVWEALNKTASNADTHHNRNIAKGTTDPRVEFWLPK